MRKLSKRAAKRPRPVLMLETLEDRRVFSVGGLFSALQPLASVQSSPAPLTSVVTSLVAVPTTALNQVGTTVQNLGGSLLGSPATTSAPSVSLNANMDVPFVQTLNLALDLSLTPIVSDQPLVSVGVGGSVALGTTTSPILSTAPQVQVGLGGSDLAVVSAGTPVSSSAGPIVAVNTGVETGGGSAATTSANTGALLQMVEAPTTGPAAGSLVASNGAISPVVALAANTPTTPAVGSPAAVPAVVLSESSSGTVLTAPDAVGADGGGAASAVDAAAVVLPAVDVAVADGGAADTAARPFDLGGGAGSDVVPLHSDMDSAGLTTRFQPYSLDLGLGTVIGRFAPQGSWLNTWLARLSHMAPWLVGLTGAGLILEIRRRLRRAKKIKSANIGI